MDSRLELESLVTLEKKKTQSNNGGTESVMYNKIRSIMIQCAPVIVSITVCAEAHLVISLSRVNG